MLNKLTIMFLWLGIGSNQNQKVIKMENFNVSTNAIYSETNQAHLEEHKENHDISANEWAGFHQWKTMGRKVKKGAKGCKIFMICEKKVDNKNGKTDEKKKVLKALYVFNIQHTEEV